MSRAEQLEAEAARQEAEIRERLAPLGVELRTETITWHTKKGPVSVLQWVFRHALTGHRILTFVPRAGRVHGHGDGVGVADLVGVLLRRYPLLRTATASGSSG
jgi:hypothetical protein